MVILAYIWSKIGLQSPFSSNVWPSRSCFSTGSRWQ